MKKAITLTVVSLLTFTQATHHHLSPDHSIKPSQEKQEVYDYIEPFNTHSDSHQHRHKHHHSHSKRHHQALVKKHYKEDEIKHNHHPQSQTQVKEDKDMVFTTDSCENDSDCENGQFCFEKKCKSDFIVKKHNNNNKHILIKQFRKDYESCDEDIDCEIDEVCKIQDGCLADQCDNKYCVPK